MDNMQTNILPEGDMQECDSDSQAVVAIVDLLTRRLDREDLLAPKDRESVAYRLAEIMMCAKDLYTNRLSCLVATDEERAKMGRLGSDTPIPDPEKPEDTAEVTVFEDLSYTRMHLIRLRDLISDFDASFMEAMANQREEDGTDETWLRDDEWLESELEDDESGHEEHCHDDQCHGECAEDEWN